jgi:2'-phosphotransferase
MNLDYYIIISKKLAYHLRHGLDKLPFMVDKSGFVRIKDLLTLPDFVEVSFEEILLVVKENDKKRFSLDESREKIRANQGHSLESGNLLDENQLLVKINKPLEYCVHGTKRKFMYSISKSGLNKMNRTHIHFASSPEGISGFRPSSDVLIYIDMKSAMENGIEFFMSTNEVILSKGPIATKYFSKIQYIV